MKPIKLSTSLDIDAALKSIDYGKPITVPITVSDYSNYILSRGPFDRYFDTSYYDMAKSLLYEVLNQRDDSILEPGRLFASGLVYDNNLVEFFDACFLGDYFINSVIEFIFDDVSIRFKFIKSFDGFDGSTMSPIGYWINNPTDIIASFVNPDIEMLITRIYCVIYQFEITDTKETVNIPIFSENGVLTR